MTILFRYFFGAVVDHATVMTRWTFFCLPLVRVFSRESCGVSVSCFSIVHGAAVCDSLQVDRPHFLNGGLNIALGVLQSGQNTEGPK